MNIRTFAGRARDVPRTAVMSQVYSRPITEDFEAHGPTRMPRSGDITRRVSVPSSEHVADIIGKKGCRIIALQTRTNTYIQTPARGESPVFFITGHPKDVAFAKLEVLAHAFHFTSMQDGPGNDPTHITLSIPVPSSDHVAMIVGKDCRMITALLGYIHSNIYVRIPCRSEDPIFYITGKPKDVDAAKRKLIAAANCITQIPAANTTMQDQSTQSLRSPVNQLITIRFRVPPDTVGFVVGRKGCRIMRIQQLTNTCIFTPTRRDEPCFIVTGKPECAEHAKREIESYVTELTGTTVESCDSDVDTVVPKTALRWKYSPLALLTTATGRQQWRQMTPHAPYYPRNLSGECLHCNSLRRQKPSSRRAVWPSRLTPLW